MYLHIATPFSFPISVSTLALHIRSSTLQHGNFPQCRTSVTEFHLAPRWASGVLNLAPIGNAFRPSSCASSGTHTPCIVKRFACRLSRDGFEIEDTEQSWLDMEPGRTMDQIN
jgi:hypothetical protein